MCQDPPVGQSGVIPIDYGPPFNFSDFVDERGWEIKEGGPFDPTELNTNLISLVRILSKNGYFDLITGEKCLGQIKDAGHSSLGIRVALTLLNNQHFIPENWRHSAKGMPIFYCFGSTILLSPLGHPYVFGLVWGKKRGQPEQWCLFRHRSDSKRVGVHWVVLPGNSHQKAS